MTLGAAPVRFTLLLCLWPFAAAAEPVYPALTGRVVDEANILSLAARQRVETRLAEHETATTNQVAVVTLSSLQGYSIEEFGVGLGRAWGIGQKGRDNGVLLIVAPSERKVRIEVGYGLEGTLTDALSHDIIENRILPEFRAGRMEAGVEAGVSGVLSALQGDYTPARPTDDRDFSALFGPWILLGAMLLFFFVIDRGYRRTAREPLDSWGASASGGSSGGGGFGGGGGFSGGGGGFGGGGGGFGGGGASGGW